MFLIKSRGSYCGFSTINVMGSSSSALEIFRENNVFNLYIEKMKNKNLFIYQQTTMPIKYKNIKYFNCTIFLYSLFDSLYRKYNSINLEEIH